MNNLGSIRKAQGLSEEDAETLDALLAVNRRYMARNKRLVDYYEADVKPPSIGIDTFPENVRVETHCDWPKKAVTSVSERSRFDGFLFANGQQDESLDQIVRDNNLKGAYNRHVHSELIHGCMFATVNQYRGKCEIRFHTAETSAAIWDDELGCIGSGLVVADSRRTKWSGRRRVPVQLNMYLPGRVVVLKRTSADAWEADTLSIPIERPSMEPFAFRPTGLKPFGSSRIDKTVMSITDSTIRTLQNMEVSSAIYAAPQKHILGLTDEQFDALSENKWRTYIGSILLSTRDGDGNVPEVGQLSAASPQPYIDILRNNAMLFSGATGVPLSSLGIVYDNPSSAEAIEAAREDICIAASDLNESNGESLRNVALMAMAIANGDDIDSLTDEQKSVTAKFVDPSMPSVVSQAAAATQIAAVAPWFTDSDVFLEMLGFDEAQRARLASVRTLQSAQQLLSAFATPTTVQTPTAASTSPQSATETLISTEET